MDIIFPYEINENKTKCLFFYYIYILLNATLVNNNENLAKTVDINPISIDVCKYFLLLYKNR